MVDWKTLPSGMIAKAIFEPQGVGPDDLKKLISSIVRHKDSDCLYYDPRRGARGTATHLKRGIDLPYLKQARHDLRGNGKRRRSKVNVILYQWFVQNIGKKKLFRTCPNSFCVNPFHFAQKHKGKFLPTIARKEPSENIPWSFPLCCDSRSRLQEEDPKIKNTVI